MWPDSLFSLFIYMLNHIQNMDCYAFHPLLELQHFFLFKKSKASFPQPGCKAAVTNNELLGAQFPPGKPPPVVPEAGKAATSGCNAHLKSPAESLKVFVQKTKPFFPGALGCKAFFLSFLLFSSQ